MKHVLLLIISVLLVSKLKAQAKFEMGYVHPFLNQSFSTQLNTSASKSYSVNKFISHTWLGIFANFNQKYALTFTFSFSSLDIRYTDDFLLQNESFKEELSPKKLVHQILLPNDNLHLSLERKYYEKNRYTLWLGLGISYVQNPWFQNNIYYIGYKYTMYGENRIGGYDSRILINKVGNRVILPISVYLNHKFIFKKREICIKTGFQFILPQKIEATVTNEFVFSQKQYSTKVSIPGSVMFYAGVQLNRVLRFRNFGSRAKKAIINSLWILPKKLDEPNE